MNLSVDRDHLGTAGDIAESISVLWIVIVLQVPQECWRRRSSPGLLNSKGYPLRRGLSLLLLHLGEPALDLQEKVTQRLGLLVDDSILWRVEYHFCW